MSYQIIKARLTRALDLTDALAVSLSDKALEAHNGAARSNTIGSQFWRLIGARESYALDLPFPAAFAGRYALD